MNPTLFRPRTLLLACALAATASLLSCTDGPRRVSLPGEGDEVAEAFPAQSAQAQKPQEKPLEISRVDPIKEIYKLRTINVTFNQPMVQSGGERPSAELFQIEPPIKGRFQWVGANTASFIPSQELPIATEFKVTVPKGTQSHKGARLRDDFSFTFSTPRLVVSRIHPSWQSARLRPDEPIFVQFSLPVSLDTMKKGTALQHQGKNLPITIKPTHKDPGGDKVPEGTAFWIEHRGKFQKDQHYELLIDAALAPQQGNLGMRKAFKHTFASYASFQATEAGCGWGRCNPWQYWFVRFNNPVLPKDVKRCITTTPKLKFKGLNGTHQTTRVTFRPEKVIPGEKYKISVSGRCKDVLGNPLARATSHEFKVEHYRPSINLKRGISTLELAPKGEEPLFPVTFLNTPDVNLRMLKLDPSDLPGFLAGFQPWSEDDTLTKAGKTATVSRPFGTKLHQDKRKTYDLNLAQVLKGAKSGIVYVDFQSDSHDRHWGDKERRFKKALVQITDLGMTAKYGPNASLFWVTSLQSAQPISGARVDIYDEQSNLLWEGQSDAEGLVKAPGFKTFHQKRPRFLITSKGDDASFLDLDNWDVKVHPYRFDVEYDWDASAEALHGFLFTERGVYRPGEEVHIKGYLRMDRGSSLEVLPATRTRVRVYNPSGELVQEEDVALSDLDGFHTTLKLGPEDQLGYWSLKAEPVGLKGDVAIKAGGSFRVEAYRAPDFEVSVEPKSKALVYGDEIEARISGQYLFGAPMQSAGVSWEANLQSTTYRPGGFDDFVFGPNANRWWWDREYRGTSSFSSGEDKLDDFGFLSVRTKVEEKNTDQETFRATISASVSDINNQTISGETSVILHPGDTYLGIQSPGYLLEAGKKADVKLVAVGLDNKVRDNVPVNLDLIKRTWSSVRKKAAGGGYTWVTETKDDVLQTCKTRTKGQKASCKIDVPDSGSYTLRATGKDTKGRAVTSSTSFYAWGGSNTWWGSNDSEKVNLVPDKKHYKVGDTARIMVQSPFKKAQALVTVERLGILQQETVTIKGSTSTLEIPITEEMLPNAYVSVTLLRGRIQNPKDDGRTVDPGKPAFKMGYTELNIDKSEKMLSVSVTPDAERYRPGDTVRATVKIEDHQGNPTSGELTFMAVDEGVLSLTGYQTPNPSGAFYRKRPLALTAAEMRRIVVARVKNASEENMGDKGEDGGGGGGGQAQNFRAAFATTATFQPLINVDASGETQVEFTLPDNLTAFRLMAVVASQGNRFGSGEKRVQVQKPLLLRPALPRFASSGDEIQVRAVVQSVGDTEGDVVLTAKASGPIELVAAHTASVTLKPGEVKEVSFPARVGEPGNATLQFTVHGQGDLKAHDAVQMTIPVRYPSATRELRSTGTITSRGDESTDQIWKRLNIPQGAHPDVGGLDIELASTALNQLLPGLDYLMDYPYGCVEQTTGRTLPLVALFSSQDNFKLPGIDADKTMGFAQAGLNRLFTMQTWTGGLGYWPGASDPHPWGSTYAGLALTMASKDSRFQVDQNKLDRLYDYLLKVAQGNAPSTERYRHEAMTNTRSFAAYVLALAGRADIATHHTLYDQRSKLSNFSRAFLAMAILTSGDESTMAANLLVDLREESTLDNAEAHLPAPEHPYWELMESEIRNDSVMLMALLQARPDDQYVAPFARGLLNKRRNGRWYSTQDNAFAVVSLLKYFQHTESAQPKFNAVVALGEKAISTASFQNRSLTPHNIHIPMRDLQKNPHKVLSLIREGGKGTLYYNLTLRYALEKPSTHHVDNGFTLERTYIAHDGPNKGKEVTEIKPGDVVQVRLRIIAPERRHYVAIEDPIPSGLEPINTSFATTSSSLKTAEREQNHNNHSYWDVWYGRINFDRVEQRDDRVLIFADDLYPGVYDHTYLARATTQGTFTVPASRIEEMYDPDTFGQSNAFTLTVAP